VNELLSRKFDICFFYADWQLEIQFDLVPKIQVEIERNDFFTSKNTFLSGVI